MGCISEWGATVSGNVCVSGIHNICILNRFDACKILILKRFYANFLFFGKCLPFKVLPLNFFFC